LKLISPIPGMGIVPAGQFNPVAGNQNDYFPETHGGYGKIRSPRPQGRNADDQTNQRRQAGSQGKGYPEGQTQGLGHDPHSIGANAEERAVGQGGLPRVPKDQVEAQGADGEQAAHHDDLKKVPVGDKQRYQEGNDQDQQIEPFFLQKGCHRPWTSLPNRPVGLMARMSTRAPKANTSL